VHVVADHHGSHIVGVFLTEADAEEARQVLTPSVPTCWVQHVPVVL
jgi:hypothetical protein